MPTVTRLYEVQTHDGKSLLVDAPNPSAAWRHVAERYVKQADVNAASAKRVAELMTAGAKVETASID